jgi:hypothetical protein
VAVGVGVGGSVGINVGISPVAETGVSVGFDVSLEDSSDTGALVQAEAKIVMMSPRIIGLKLFILRLVFEGCGIHSAPLARIFNLAVNIPETGGYCLTKF